MTDKEFFDLPYPSYYATDFGLSAPTANIEFKFDGDKNIFLSSKTIQANESNDRFFI